MHLRRPPRLRTLLLLSNLAVLALPVTGLWAMRLYESALVRQTEAELVAQAAVWAAVFRQELRRTAPEQVAPQLAPGVAALSAAGISMLRRPGLDLAADPVLPPPPDPVPAVQPAGAAAVAIGSAMAPMVHDAQAITQSALRITDGNGVVIASTNADLGASLAGWEEVAGVLAGAPIVTSMRSRNPVQAAPSSMSRTAGLRVFVALPVLTEGVEDGAGPGHVAGVIVLSRTPRDVVQAMWGKRAVLGGWLALLLTAGMVLAAGLSRLVAWPLSLVVAQARRVVEGGDIVPLERPGTREVADLSAAISQMAVRLEQRARYIIAFAASVSHEFKTPLAGLRGAAELLEDHVETLPAAERARLLQVVSGSTARLDHLVRRLLDLARADMMRAGGGAATPVGAVLAGLLPRYRACGMRIGIEGEATVGLAADALEALLTSLLDNAARYASADGLGGGAEVSIGVGSSQGRTTITVADAGPGVSAANRARVFDPFFTTARAVGGTGLGLSIVRAIAAGAGGSAALVDSVAGARFRIELPAGGGTVDGGGGPGR